MSGMHVKWLVAGVAFDKLIDIRLIENFLYWIIGAVRMRALGIHVYNVRETLQNMGIKPNPDEPEGVSAVAVLSTSHCSIATWPHQGFFVFDLYSCTDFDQGVAESLLKTVFKPGKVKATDLSYSLEWDADDELRVAARDAVEDLERLGGPNRITTKALAKALIK